MYAFAMLAPSELAFINKPSGELTSQGTRDERVTYRPPIIKVAIMRSFLLVDIWRDQIYILFINLNFSLESGQKRHTIGIGMIIVTKSLPTSDPTIAIPIGKAAPQY